MTTSLKRKKKRKILRKARETINKKLPIYCLSCGKDLFSSIHHFFCDKCWTRIHGELKRLGDQPANWCLICNKKINGSSYFYLCEIHGNKMALHQGKTLTRKKILQKQEQKCSFNF